MSRIRAVSVIVLIAALAVAAAAFDFPSFANRGLERAGLGYRVPEAGFKLGLDLQGGVHLVYRADLSGVRADERAEAMRGLRDVIERRVNLFGVAEPVVQTQGADEQARLIVELAGVSDPAQAVEVIGQTPFLEFRELSEEVKEDPQAVSGERPFVPTGLTGKYLEEAQLGFGQTTQEPFISLQFDEEGAELFEGITSRNVGLPIALYLDGVPLQAPVVQQAIEGGRAQITGVFTVEEARALVRDLNAGALPVPIELISQQSVGPVLGQVSLEQSLRAALWAFVAVAVFMTALYRLPGLVSAAALLAYAVLILAFFKGIGATFTLAGVGGLILSVGMAVDANILIFSRMREELARGRDVSAAVTEGFARAWPSIRDGNVTTLLVALILFWFGTSFVQGFALMLSVGILLSMFSAMVVTRSMLSLLPGKKPSRLIL